MTKRKVPVKNARGYCDAATVTALLDGPLGQLEQAGQEVCLQKPLMFTVVNDHDELKFSFQFDEGSLVAQLRVGSWEYKAGHRSYLLRSPDTTMQVYIRSFQGSIYFINSRDTNASRVYMRPSIASALGMQVDMSGPTPRK